MLRSVPPDAWRIITRAGASIASGHRFADETPEEGAHLPLVGGGQLPHARSELVRKRDGESQLV